MSQKNTQSSNTALWSTENLKQIVQWLEGAYPEEGCGLIHERSTGAFEVETCENLANKYHALDPETFPRTAKTFYMINPMAFSHSEREGGHVTVVFHSHCDVGDYFSDEDVAAATMPRFEPEDPLEPSHPNTDYLVVSVRDGVADRATLFAFDASIEGFVARTIITIKDGTFSVADGEPS